MNERKIDWIAKHAANQPDKICLVDIARGDRLTYRQLNERIAQLAGHLKALGIKRGDRVAALTSISGETVEIQHAAWRLGAIFVPVNNRLAGQELAYIFSDASPVVVFVDIRFVPVIDQIKASVPVRHWITCCGDANPYQQLLVHSQPRHAQADPDEFDANLPAQIIYSSGTTGRPKGVVHSHKTLMYALLCRIVPGSVDRETAALCTMPLFHITGLNGMVNATHMAGGCIVLLERFDAGQLLEIINDKDLAVSYLFAVPTMLDSLRKHPQVLATDFSRIRTCFTGTAPVARELIEWWAARQVPISQAYGMTETAAATSLASVADNLKNPATIGKPVLFADYRIMRDDGTQAQINEVGELWIRSPSNMVGYWNNPEATAATLVNSWLKTGDLLSVDEEGYYFIKGRSKDMYISGGENVYPAEVEDMLRNMPDIHQVAVIGVPHEKWGETSCAVVVTEPGATLTLEKIEAFCATRLAKFKWPKHLVVVDALPLNATGKVNKVALRESLPALPRH